VKERVDAFLGALEWVEVKLSALLLLLMVCAVSIQVVFRYFLQHPLSWPEELTILLSVWLTFIAASAALKKNMHVAVDFVVSLVPEAVRNAAGIASDILIVAFLTVLIVSTARLIPFQMRSRIVSLRMPKAAYSVPVLVASASMLLSATYSLVMRIVSAASARTKPSANLDHHDSRVV